MTVIGERVPNPEYSPRLYLNTGFYALSNKSGKTFETLVDMIIEICEKVKPGNYKKRRAKATLDSSVTDTILYEDLRDLLGERGFLERHLERIGSGLIYEESGFASLNTEEYTEALAKLMKEAAKDVAAFAEYQPVIGEREWGIKYTYYSECGFATLETLKRGRKTVNPLINLIKFMAANFSYLDGEGLAYTIGRCTRFLEIKGFPGFVGVDEPKDVQRKAKDIEKEITDEERLRTDFTEDGWGSIRQEIGGYHHQISYPQPDWDKDVERTVEIVEYQEPKEEEKRPDIPFWLEFFLDDLVKLSDRTETVSEPAKSPHEVHSIPEALKVLGLEGTPSMKQVRKTYHAKAHLYHPDHTGADEVKFKQVTEAYAFLKKKLESF